MNELQELIDKLCPNGVKFETLRDVVDFTNGKGHEKVVEENGKYILITSKAISTNMEQVRRTNKILTPLNIDDITMVMSDLPNGKALAKCFIIDEEDKYTLNQRVCGLKVKNLKQILPKYLYYILNRNTQLLRYDNGVDQTNLKKDDILNIRIAVPPLEVQCEIVHILDDFTLLSAELSAELKARQKQFNYYRDELIKNAPNAEYKTLEEISTEMYRGAGIKRDEVTETGIPCVRYGEIYTTYNVLFDTCVSHTDEEKQKSKKYFEYGDVLFAITGESVEEIGKSTVYLGKDKCLAGGDIVVMKHKENPKYIGYALSTTEAQMQKSKGKVKSKVVHSSVPSLKEISIPIPSLDEQERIAVLIENFDKLCNDITSGIPAEIVKRQKQYEYYRDKLLSFKEVEVNE